MFYGSFFQNKNDPKCIFEVVICRWIHAKFNTYTRQITIYSLTTIDDFVNVYL